jgi:hypothetical protein
MQKLLTTILAAGAFAVAASAARADCYGDHNVTASKAPSVEAVSISTHDGPPVPVAVEEAEKKAEAAATPACAEGDKDCKAGTE